MKLLPLFLLMRSVAPRALPQSPTITQLDDRNEGEPPSGRTIFTAFSIMAIMIVSFLFGSRFHKLRRRVFLKRNLMSCLVLLLYIFVLLFTILSAVLVVGQGMRNQALCVAATWVCLVFYVAAKGTIYIFLVERIHVVRAPFVVRRKDRIYLTCLTLVLTSFTAVSINAWLSPVITMSDGRCHMGIPARASIPFVAVDVAVSVIVTGFFVYLLRPVVKLHRRLTISEVLKSKGPPKSSDRVESRETSVQRNIRILLWKSLIGSALIMIPTAGNMIQFVITAGKELGLICLSICVLDVCFDVTVMHWLTSNSAEQAERSLASTLTASNPTMAKRSSTTLKSAQAHEREEIQPAIAFPEEPRALPNIYSSVRLPPDTRMDCMPDLLLPRVSGDSEELAMSLRTQDRENEKRAGPSL